MADNFTIIGQREDVEFIGGTTTQAVITVSAVTKPNAIYYEFRIPRNLYLADAVGAGALSYASIYEDIAAIPYVAGVEWSQSPTASGELQDTVTVTVASTSGNSSASFSLPLNKIGPDLTGNEVKTLHDQLDAAEAL